MANPVVTYYYKIYIYTQEQVCRNLQKQVRFLLQYMIHLRQNDPIINVEFKLLMKLLDILLFKLAFPNLELACKTCICLGSTFFCFCNSCLSGEPHMLFNKFKAEEIKIQKSPSPDTAFLQTEQ